MNASLRARLRWGVLLALLAGSAWLALSDDGKPVASTDDRVVRPVSRPALPPLPRTKGDSTLAAAPAASGVEVLVPRGRLLAPASGASRDLFESAASATPAPPLRVAPAAPAAPLAPPALPYRFLGKKIEQGEWEVFLVRDEMSFVVRMGSTLESEYRVEKISPPAMWLRHLPTGQVMTMAIGDSW